MSFTSPALGTGTQSWVAGYLEGEPDTLPPHSIAYGENCLLINPSRGGETTIETGRAILRKRTGSRLVTPAFIAGAGPARVDGLFEFPRESAPNQLLAVSDGQLVRYDNASATILEGPPVFTAGRPARLLNMGDQGYLCDGTVNRRWDGTASYVMGIIAPSSAPGLVANAGPGVTGTYEGYSTWYNAGTDAESNPSPTSSALPLVNQSRFWTAPGFVGQPVTHWRIYVRRVDTNEQRFYLVGSVPIGANTHIEAVSDGARTIAAPDPAANGIPPPFALMAEYKGCRIGVPANSANLYISSPLHPEAQHPKNVFPIGGGDDQGSIRCMKAYGQELLIQKPRQSYRLIGDRLPFQPIPITSSLGNVSQEASLAVRDWYYGWDELAGPYRTNLGVWQTLGDGRIDRTLKSVTRTALDRIRAVHVERHGLIIWAIPTGGATRIRTLLPYSYLFECWLPPMTGLEYASLATFTDPTGALGVYCGDEWGRLWRLFDGERDAPAGATLQIGIAAATATTITVTPAGSLYTTGAGLAGLQVAVLAGGALQWARIQSNTDTVITLDTTHGPALNPIPPGDGSAAVRIGTIRWSVMTPQFTMNAPSVEKIARWLHLEWRASAQFQQISCDLLIDGAAAVARRFYFEAPAVGLDWGEGHLGPDTSTAAARAHRKRRITRTGYRFQLRFENFDHDLPFAILSYAIECDPKIRSVSSA